jgi:hypothetical protein
MKQSNFNRLETEGLIDKTHDFSEEDRRAIESLSPEEVETIIKLVYKLSPNWSKAQAEKLYGTSLRGIIL